VDSYCRECRKVRNKRWKEDNKERVRKVNQEWYAQNQEHVARRGRANLYGLTHEEALDMFKKQHGSCGICQQPLDFYKAHLDHSHSTGKARGFLCRNCNIGLGHFKDDLDLLDKAMEYLVRGN
jgi:hypothetical protein